jgi:hypothetical protein
LHPQHWRAASTFPALVANMTGQAPQYTPQYPSIT